MFTLNQNPLFLGFIFLISKEHSAGDKVKALSKENIIAVAIVTESGYKYQYSYRVQVNRLD